MSNLTKSPSSSLKPASVGALNDAPFPRPIVAWGIVAAFFVAYIFSFIDRMIIGLLVESIKADLKLSDTQIGLLQGFAFALFYTVAGIPIGRLIDRAPRMKIVAAGIFVWSIMTAICAGVTNFWQFFIARMGVGVGEAVLSPAAYSVISDSFPKGRLGLPMGVYGLGSAMGAGLAFMLGAVVVALVANADATVLPILGEVKAWQVAFLVAGLPGLLIAALFLFLPEPKRRFTEAEANDKSPVPMSAVMDHMRENKVFFWCLFLAVGMVNLSVLGSISWLPAMLMRTFGMELAAAGYLSGAMLIIGGLIGLIGGGALMDRIGGGTPQVRLRFCGWSAAIGSIGALTFPLTDSIPLLAVSFILFFSAAAVAVGAAPSTIQQLAPNRMRATISAAYVFVINAVGLGAGPTLTAMIGDNFFAFESGIRYAIAIVAVSGYIVGAILFFIAARNVEKHAH
ncbi:MFS transporter [Algimonas arctica]|uniref:MFS transporter n=1 Tax=Algimonas arctica TaxID=1479486 RepID=UPI001674DEDD|nr:MFS transporter [Algimonas arctica]